MFRSAYKQNNEIVFYFDHAGNKYVASGGNLAWSINNPGLLRCHSPFARRNFTFGGGSFIPPGKCRPDSHNFASVNDLVCFFGSPNSRTLAMRRYMAFKEDLTQEQMTKKWAQEDSIFYLDTIDAKAIQIFENKRIEHFEKQLEEINNVTVLDSGLEYEHAFYNVCYQNEVKVIIDRFKRTPNLITATIPANLIDCVAV